MMSSISEHLVLSDAFSDNMEDVSRSFASLLFSFLPSLPPFCSWGDWFDVAISPHCCQNSLTRVCVCTCLTVHSHSERVPCLPLLFHPSKKSSKHKNRGETLASKFSSQMQVLVRELESTWCSFVRCIKPNPNMQVGVFDSDYVLQQLKWAGIRQTCDVLRAVSWCRS